MNAKERVKRGQGQSWVGPVSIKIDLSLLWVVKKIAKKRGNSVPVIDLIGMHLRSEMKGGTRRKRVPAVSFRMNGQFSGPKKKRTDGRGKESRTRE